SPHDSWTFFNHFKTLPLPFQQSLTNPQQFLHFLTNPPQIPQLYYPPNHPIHLSQPQHPPPLIPFPLKHQSQPQAFLHPFSLPLLSVTLPALQTILSHPPTISHPPTPPHLTPQPNITFPLFTFTLALQQPQQLIPHIQHPLHHLCNQPIPNP
ncbi:PLP-dependent transferase, partial [Staphylococcus auricularis]|uniref:PLP-dependent transferase n=1 Tax=Staphylococcus auricularis TaxID=29379 RepID=UPI001785D6DD